MVINKADMKIKISKNLVEKVKINENVEILQHLVLCRKVKHLQGFINNSILYKI